MTVLLTLLLVFIVQVALYAQGAASDAIAVSNTGIDALISQAVISAAAAYAIQGWKKASWLPGISPDTNARVLKAVAAGVALLTSIGIHYSFDPVVGSLTITGLTITGIKDHGYDWLRSWVLQQITYDRVIDPPVTSAAVITTGTGGH